METRSNYSLYMMKSVSLLLVVSSRLLEEASSFFFFTRRTTVMLPAQIRFAQKTVCNKKGAVAHLARHTYVRQYTRLYLRNYDFETNCSFLYDERTKRYSQEMLLDGPSSFENQINRDLDIYTYLYR